jgi:hypothetical protein
MRLLAVCWPATVVTFLTWDDRAASTTTSCLSRPMVRENEPELGDLLTEFDFTQKPVPRLVLPLCPVGVDTLCTDAGPCK